MKFVSRAIPEVTEGLSFVGVEETTVPNMEISLKEILERFTRNEAVPVGKPTSYLDDEGDNDVDVEKLQHKDLVDKEIFYSEVERKKKTYERQEAKKEKDRKEKIAAEERAKIEAETRAKLDSERGNGPAKPA